MEKLRKARKGYRALSTKISNEIIELLNQENPDEDVVRSKWIALQDYYNSILDYDQRIIDLIIDEGDGEKDLETELARTLEYKEKFLITTRKVDRFLGKADTASATTPPPHTAVTKYPKITLKKFDGDLREWLGFWAQFKNIHENEHISVADKFQYLVQSMIKGSKAQSVVESYPQCDENYMKAVEALQRRFGNENLLVEVYVRELLKLIFNNLMSGPKDNKGLSRMYDSLGSHVRALETLGVTSDKFAAILLPLIESSLPTEILKVWQHSPKNTESSYEDYSKKLQDLMNFLRLEVESEEKLTLARSGFENTIKSPQKDKTEEHGMRRNPTAAGLHIAAENNKLCIFCEAPHESERCYKARSMSFDEKRNKIAEKKRCYVCFGSAHMAKACKADIKCQLCGRRHYAILCHSLPNFKVQNTNNSKENEPTNKITGKEFNNEKVKTSTNTTHYARDQILLQTILVKVATSTEKRIVRILLDSGAQRSYIKNSSAKLLRMLSVRTEWLQQTVFGGIKSDAHEHDIYEFSIESLRGRSPLKIEALGQERICGEIPRLRKGPWLKELKENGVWINDIGGKTVDIDILIGSDYYGKTLTGRIINLRCGLTAIETLWGWSLVGAIHKDTDRGIAMAVTNLSVTENSVCDLWNLETIGILDPAESLSKLEREEYSRQHFSRTIRVNDEKRYEVSLPWTREKKDIPDNKVVALRRLNSMTKRLIELERFQDYDTIFKDWEENGFIERVNENEEDRHGHFLPHRPIFKNSETTPIRPVFDASSKAKGAPSLNDCLEKGPNLLEMVPTILLRFREKQCGVIADIRKAFMMISVNESDRDYLRFLWWKSADLKDPMIYRHTRVVFGLNCSPFLLNAVITYHLENAPSNKKSCADKLRSCLYVDNCVTSVNSIDEFNQFREEAIDLLKSAKMDLRLWESNGEMSFGSQEPTETCTNVLGLSWDKLGDTLSCTTVNWQEDQPLTRRKILSIIQRIYDPMGFLSPAMLEPKLLLQESWLTKGGWDDELPRDILSRFVSWIASVHVLTDIKIPRWITGSIGTRTDWSLHVFCDASKRGYAAAVYLRSGSPGRVQTSLLIGKARVAPLKPKITIPRMELMACLIGSRLVVTVKKALNCEDVKTYCWSDSKVALAWIKRENNWETFVRNRVKEIINNTRVVEWGYVPSPDNPADLPSRGCSPRELLGSRWWEGPAWLKEEKDSWPEYSTEEDEIEINAELKRVVANHVDEERVWYARKFSKYSRIVKLIGWVMRFINNLRRVRDEEGSGSFLALSVSEINEAEKKLVWLVQQESFGKERKLRLETTRDEQDLIRVCTKVARSGDPYDFRYPLLLPTRHVIVDALVREIHEENCHCGVQVLMNTLREKFWILQSRRAVRRVKEKCKRCRRFESKSYDHKDTPLPADRCKMAKVFEVTGVDLAGPLYLDNESKAWIVLFTCAIYRAVHLEVVTSLSTQAFLQAFRRFVARRGRPSTVYSDNGTNFLGTENLMRALDWDYIVTNHAIRRMQWKFNPPTAAWWGGWWERLIRTVKELLIRVLGKALIGYEELVTVICDVESVVNSRPLTYLSEDPEDLSPLTPAMFLKDLTSASLPDVDIVEADLQGRAKFCQRLREDLRSRFRKEYLSQLVQKHKEEKGRRVSLGDIVLVGEDKKRIFWNIGRVVALYPGRDGVDRVARVKTARGELVRPTKRLYFMEAERREISDEVLEHEPPLVDEKSTVELKETEVMSKTRSGREVRMPERYK